MINIEKENLLHKLLVSESSEKMDEHYLKDEEFFEKLIRLRPDYIIKMSEYVDLKRYVTNKTIFNYISKYISLTHVLPVIRVVPLEFYSSSALFEDLEYHREETLNTLINSNLHSGPGRRFFTNLVISDLEYLKLINRSKIDNEYVLEKIYIAYGDRFFENKLIKEFFPKEYLEPYINRYRSFITRERKVASMANARRRRKKNGK